MNLNNNFKKDNIYLFVFFVISLITLSLSFTRIFDSLYYINSKLSDSTRGNLYALGISLNRYGYYFSNAQSILKENQDLKNKLYSLDSTKSINETLFKENTLLKSQIASDISPKSKLLLANIIYESNLLDYLTLDKGTNEGVKKNDIIVLNNYVVGRIIDVDLEESKVEVITSRSSSVSVSILSVSSNISGKLVASVKDGLIITNLYQTDTVTLGETVITSGLDGIYPHGLLVGHIKNIKNNISNGEKIAIVNDSVDISELSQVFILLKN